MIHTAVTYGETVTPEDVVFLVSKTGGITISNDWRIASGGIMVSLAGFEVQLPVLTEDDVTSYMETYSPEFMGILVDSETGIVYIDTTTILEDRDEAIKLGIENKQKAIWDDNLKEEIDLRPFLKGSSVRLGASVQENAQATIDELIGNQAPGGHHKPARTDIQKMKDVWDLYEKKYPGGSGKAIDDESGRASKEWEDKYELTDDEKNIVDTYKGQLRRFNVQALNDPQRAFERTVEWVNLTGGLDHQPTPGEEAKRLVGKALKKYEQQYWGVLYQQINNCLGELYRTCPESYKLWPKAVTWIKDEYQNWLWNGNSKFDPSDSVELRSWLNLPHMRDIVREGGELLSKLRADNRIPQNFDVNQLSFADFEKWLMDWKRENREAEAQGEVVYEFHDGWTIQKLTTPEQLQYEGDEMGHCLLPSALVGYTPVPDVREGLVTLGETVYDARVLPFSGKALRISTAGTLPIEVTPEHQFLIVRPKKSSYFKKRMPEDLEPQWLRANEIEIGDYLLSPDLDLRPMSMRGDLAWLYGVYIGDGGTNGSSKAGAPLSGIHFTLGAGDDLDRLVETLTYEGYKPKVKDHGTYKRVRVNSRSLAKQFVEWFGSGSQNKRMPDWLLGHPSALEGILAADGHFNKSDQSWTFTSTSLVLAQQVWLAARSQGYYPSITTYKRKEGRGYPNAKPSWKVRWQINERRWAVNRQWRDWYVTPIKNIEEFRYEGDVYSPETVSHTYLVNGVICHNCVGGQSYASGAGGGSIIIYSLRSPKGTPHVTMEVRALEGPEALFDPETDETPEDAVYNHEYIHPDKHAPGDHLERKDWHSADGQHGTYKKSGDSPFEIVQIQGKGNNTPKSEYQHKIKEFLDYLRGKGWDFVRADDWYHNYDDDAANSEYAITQDPYERRNGAEWAKKLDDWYDDHYKQNHNAYRGGYTDPYGMQMAPTSLYVKPNWSEMLYECMASLVNEYDPGRWKGNWETLAQAVYHGFCVAENQSGPKKLQHLKSLFEGDLERAGDQLNDWEHYQKVYALESDYGDLAVRLKQACEENGTWPSIESDINMTHPEGNWNDGTMVDFIREREPDLFEKVLQEEVEAHYSGKAHRFLQYLHYLVGKQGLVSPQDLPDPNQNHGGLPSYEDLEAMPWPKPEEPNLEIPGTLSSWHEAMAERSGDPELDKLIEEFLRGPLYQSMDNTLLRDPQWAAGMCNVMATQFAEFLREQGLEAESLSEDGNLAASPEDFGYGDRSIPGHEQHDVTYVDINDQTYMVDWTAAQYGYKEFPMVQKLDDQGGWQRKWSSADIQIHPIDQEHNVWFDEDGNQRNRYRPTWVKGESGKMEQIGDLEDSFLDKQGRQGQGYAAYHGDKPIGSLTYVEDPAGWYMLGTAYTHPDYRERGIFNQLAAPLRETGKPIDAYVWNNPWLKNKVRSWRDKTAALYPIPLPKKPTIHWVDTPNKGEFSSPDRESYGLPFLYHPESNQVWINTCPGYHEYIYQSAQIPGSCKQGRYNHLRHKPSYVRMWNEMPGIVQRSVETAIQERHPGPVIQEQPEPEVSWDDILNTHTANEAPKVNWVNIGGMAPEFSDPMYYDYGLPFFHHPVTNQVWIGNRSTYHGDLRRYALKAGNPIPSVGVQRGRYNHLRHTPCYEFEWNKKIHPAAKEAVQNAIHQQYPNPLPPEEKRPATMTTDDEWNEFLSI